MTGKTHIIGGIAMASVFSLCTDVCLPHYEGNLGNLLECVEYGIYLFSVSTGAVLLDIDKKNTTMSNKHPIISFFVRLFVSHRGFTHSLLFLGICYILSLFLMEQIPLGLGLPICYGLLIGIGSHILLDSLNPHGVPLFYPIKQPFSFAKIKSDGIEDFFVRCLLRIVCIISFTQLFPIQRLLIQFSNCFLF